MRVCIYKRRRVRLILLSHSLPHKHTHTYHTQHHTHTTHTQIHTHNTHNSTHTPHTHHTHTTHTTHTTYYYQHARARATCKAVCGSSTQSTSFIVKAIAISLEIIPGYSCLINYPWKTAIIAAVGMSGKSSISSHRDIWTASCLLTVCRWTRCDPIVTDKNHQHDAPTCLHK